MVQPMHNGICAGAHIVRPLCDIGEYKKETFPGFGHGKSPM
jgi:hypothetical protein